MLFIPHPNAAVLAPVNLIISICSVGLVSGMLKSHRRCDLNGKTRNFNIT